MQKEENSKIDSELVIRRTFDALDLDKNGKISREELATQITSSEKELDAVMAFADTDNDGEIDFEEFKRVIEYLENN